jgi:hypothetical protein
MQIEREKKLLAERLALVTRYANDMIVLLDATTGSWKQTIRR